MKKKVVNSAIILVAVVAVLGTLHLVGGRVIAFVIKMHGG